jgi:hypothetical protein
LAIFLGFWVIPSIFTLVRIQHESLEIADGWAIRHTRRGTKRMEIGTAARARWKIGNGGSVVLINDSERIRIEFWLYDRDERLWLIEFFRRAIPAAVQQAWDRFCHWVALPLRTQVDGLPAAPGPDDVFVTRAGRDQIFLSATALSVEIGGGLTWLLGRNEFWLFPAAVVAMWVFLRFSVPRNGAFEKGLSIDRDLVRFLTFLITWTAIAFAGILLFTRFGRQIPQAVPVGAAAQAIWWAILLVAIYWLSRKARPALARAERQSAQQWESAWPTIERASAIRADS